MGRLWLVLIAIVILIAGWRIWEHRSAGSDVMEYRGEKIKLSKTYYDFDEYKNDPDNIHPSENARVQRLVVEAPIAHWFSNRLDLFRAIGDIAFPGYGSGSGGGPQADGSELLAVAVEIPRAEKDRYIVFRGHDGRYELIDDFVQDEIPPPFGVREDDGSYVFYSRDGKEAFRRPAVQH